MDRALCLYLLSNFATSNKKISMKTKMIVVVVLAAMCVLPLSAQVKVGVEGGTCLIIWFPVLTDIKPNR
jgi:hypothetical protein